MANYAFLSSFKKYVNSSVLLIGATILALLVANLDATRELYKEVWTLPVNLSVGGFNLFSHGGHTMSLGAFINDFLMAIFFLSVGLEIKREFLCGELSSMKKALLPIIGACGGMIVPVIVFFILCGLTSSDPLAERGMAIPMATDIAFSLGVLSMFSRRVPMGLKIFLAALAVTDDLGGIIVIGVKYTDHLSLNYVLGAIACVFLLVYGNLRQTRSKMFYLSIGIALWYCMLNSGIHATMAGVVLAFCIPANLPDGTKFYIERIRNNIRKFPVIEVSSDDRNKPALLNEDDISLLNEYRQSLHRCRPGSLPGFACRQVCRSVQLQLDECQIESCPVAKAYELAFFRQCVYVVRNRLHRQYVHGRAELWSCWTCRLVE